MPRKPKDPSEPSKPQAQWGESRSKLVLDELLNQADNHSGRAANGFKPSAWQAVVLSLKDMGYDYDVTQVKNHYTSINSQYKILKEILGTSGMGWDDEKQLVRCDDEGAWDAYCSTHKGSEPFRKKAFPLYEALDKLNGHLAPAGEHRTGTNTTKRSLEQRINNNPLTQAETNPDDLGPRPLGALDGLDVITPAQKRWDEEALARSTARVTPEASGSSLTIDLIHPDLDAAASDVASSTSHIRNHPYLQSGRVLKHSTPKPRKHIGTTSKPRPTNISTAITTITENRAAKVEAAVARDEKKSIREEAKATATIQAAQLKNEKYPNSKAALKIFETKSKSEFPDVKTRIEAAKILRGEDDACFFVSLDDETRWEWLKGEMEASSH
ncbi:hypothetical protein DFH28DRAFT_1217836 [Melampsora americana]|nr:hypothetical protein DFH28DRAFT_1217836 [Melampsora americana]